MVTGVGTEPVAGEGADRDLVTGITDVRQVLDPTDVDEHRWLSQSELHQRQQAVSTGEELGVVAVLADEADRFGGGTRTGVLERGGDHLLPPVAD